MSIIVRQEGRRNVEPVPCKQKRRPGQVRKREIWVNGRLHGVHRLRNIRKQRGRQVAYATTTIHRSAVERQDVKTFYIDTDLGRRRIDKECDDLLKYFKPRQNALCVYLPHKKPRPS